MSFSIFELKRIVQFAGLADSPSEQSRRIVNSVCEVIGTEICSLYKVNDDNNLMLLASHGLTVEEALVIPHGVGLVGLVAGSANVVNVEDAAKHPAYHYVVGSSEEKYPGFCGVPVIRKGRVAGVLVVQSVQRRKIDSQSEAFLETLASHLALTIESPAHWQPLNDCADFYLSGISGSPGIGIGTPKLSKPINLASVPIENCQTIDEELAAWRILILKTSEEIVAEMNLLAGSVASDTASIFDAYYMLLQDQVFVGHVEEKIRSGLRLPSALKLSIAHFTDLFFNMADPYISARHEDIGHLGNKLYRVWLNEQDDEVQQNENTEPVILVGETLSVSDIANLVSKNLAGVVCVDGSALSHIAVLANALGIPAVMGVGELPALGPRESIIVDGHNARVVLKPGATLLAEYRGILESHRQQAQRLKSIAHKPSVTVDGVRIHLLANTGLQEDLQPGIDNGAEGIGLYRTEIPFMIRQNLPSEDEQVAVYSKILAAYADKPVYIRTLDIGSDKPLPYLPKIEENNPALGLRGIRYTLDNRQLLVTQIRAILRASGERDDVHLLIPMVSSTVELDQVLELLEASVLVLREAGYCIVRPKVGVMVEVPAVISLLPFWRKKIDFVSIGTNDLSQYLLAVDRTNPLVAGLYDSVHPSVLTEIKRIVDWANETNLPLCVCGEMASDPVAVLLLLGMGVRRLSMSSAKVPYIKSLVRCLNTSDASALLAASLATDNPGTIRSSGIALLDQMGFSHPTAA